MSAKSAMVKIGDFLFRWRNLLFPSVIAAALIAAPPSDNFLGRRDLEWAGDLIAIALMAAGLILRGAVIGFAYIKRGGMKKKVYAADLVTSGMFGVCRNPLYVGNMLMYAGIAVMHGNPWVVLGLTATFAFMYQAIVYAEERYLAEKFGPGYLAYCADVPRWALRFSRFREATEGMRFDLRKALLVDYNPILNGVFILAGIEIYERVYYRTGPDGPIVWMLGGLMVASLIATGLVHYYKRHWRKAPAPVVDRPPVNEADIQGA